MRDMNKKILAIIPARGGSKGIPKKNIQIVAGKPLIFYTIEKALQSKYINRIIVSTDDNEIAEIVKKYGAEVLIRPKELALDDIPDLPVFQHALKELRKTEEYCPDLVIHLRPTCPLRIVDDIDNAIEKMLKTNCDSVRTIRAIKDHPYWTSKVEGDHLSPFLENYDVKKYYQRQLLPDAYITNGAADVLKSDIIMNNNNLYGKDIRSIITPAERSVDIDTEFDLKLVEILLKERGE